MFTATGQIFWAQILGLGSVWCVLQEFWGGGGALSSFARADLGHPPVEQLHRAAVEARVEPDRRRAHVHVHDFEAVAPGGRKRGEEKAHHPEGVRTRKSKATGERSLLLPSRHGKGLYRLRPLVGV